MKSGNRYNKRLSSWRTRQKNGLSSIGTELQENADVLEQTLPKGSPLRCMYHQACSTLLYDIFIRILAGEPNTLLIISGKPTDEELKVAWAEIMSEYSELVHTVKSDSIFDVWKKCHYTYWKICFVECALLKLKLKDPDSGKYCYDKETADGIALLGYDFVEAPVDGEEEVYLQQINMIDIEARNLVVILNQYRQEYKLLAPDEDPNMPAVKRTLGDYEKELAELSRWVGHWVDKKLRTVSDVVAIINAYIDAQKINYAS